MEVAMHAINFPQIPKNDLLAEGGVAVGRVDGTASRADIKGFQPTVGAGTVEDSSDVTRQRLKDMRVGHVQPRLRRHMFKRAPHSTHGCVKSAANGTFSIGNGSSVSVATESSAGSTAAPWMAGSREKDGKQRINAFKKMPFFILRCSHHLADGGVIGQDQETSSESTAQEKASA